MVSLKKFNIITGKIYIYDKKGFLQRVANYENGKYIGDETLSEKTKRYKTTHGSKSDSKVDMPK